MAAGNVSENALLNQIQIYTNQFHGQLFLDTNTLSPVKFAAFRLAAQRKTSN